jgi:adenylylsulfate kinase
MKNLGHVFWIFGLSGAGKSTLAVELRREFARTAFRDVLMLDGDRFRAGVSRGLGFDDSDRAENLRRGSEVARLGVESGLIVIAAFITPREEHRTMIRTIVGESCLSLIYLDAPLDVCRTRDTKGFYARAVTGDLAHFIGVDARFDEPRYADLRVNTAANDVANSTRILADFAYRRTELAHSVKLEVEG